MHARVLLASIVGAATVMSAAGAARAQFYDLDGAYRCLTTPDTKCRAASKPLPPAPPPPPKAEPSVAQIILDIRAGKVTGSDIHLLEAKAAAKAPRAVEALAWCKLNGLGVAADPVAAYTLYGEAAQLGIPTAKANQNAIYETRLTQEQRQLVLLRAQTAP